MSRFPDNLAAFILAALCVVAIAILAGLGVAVPDVLTTVALVSSGAGAGASVPRLRAAEPAPLAAPTAPAPVASVGVIP